MNTLDVEYRQLRLLCQEFNPQDLGVSTSLILLFQLNADKLPKDELGTAVNCFKEKFPDVNVEVLFLKDLLVHCEKKGGELLLLIGMAPQWFTQENLSQVGHKIASRWLAMFDQWEQDREKLTKVCIAYSRAGFAWKAKSIKKTVVVECSGRQKQNVLFPMLAYNPVPLSFKATAVEVVRVFEKYLFDGKIEGDPLDKDPHLWWQLFDAGRRLQDGALQNLSYEKLCMASPLFYLTMAAKNVQEGNFEGALKHNSEDALSHEALGTRYLNEKKFRLAWEHFKKGSWLAPFHYDLYLKQVEAIVELMKTEEILPSLVQEAESVLKKFSYLFSKEIKIPEVLDEFHMARGEFLLEKGDREGARKEFNCLKDQKDPRLKRPLVLLSDEHALKWGLEVLKRDVLDFEVRLAYASALFRSGKKEEAKDHFLKADPNLYFRKALALQKPLELLPALRIAYYFLKRKTEEEVFHGIAHLFLHSSFSERTWEVSHVLFCLAGKIQDEKMREAILNKAHELAQEEIKK